MKFLAILLLTTLALHATPGDPGKAAIEFLEKVRERKINLDAGGDTALSGRTTARKRRQIAKRLDRLARDLGTEPLEIGDVRLDDDLAAVLVRKSGGFDPGNLRVFPVAMVRKDTGWEAAPVPASFENAGAGYAVALRKRAEELENWMLRQQVVVLEKLKTQAAERMRGRISEKLSISELKKLDVRQIGDRFLAACASGDLATALGFLGGLSENLPDDWSLRLRKTENALKSPAETSPPWHLLVDPQVAHAIVLVEDDGDSPLHSGLFTVAFLDPNGRQVGMEREAPNIEVIHFNLTKSRDGLWRIDLPPVFLAAELSSDIDTDPDSELIDAFPAAWRAAHPASPGVTAETVSQACFAALAQGDFAAFLSNLDLTGDPAKAAKSCVLAARVWRDIRGGGTAALALPLAFHSEKTCAAAVYQAFVPRDPDKHDLRTFTFMNTSGAWFWQPDPSKDTRDILAAWLTPEKDRLADDWQTQLLAPCPVVARPAAPTAEDARQCVTECLNAIARGDMTSALAHVALLDSARSPSNTLRILGYEVIGARGNPEPPIVTTVYSGDSFAAVAVKSHLSDGAPAFPLYPVVMTAMGPRILMEIDLFASNNRSRFFLNKDSLQRLANATTEEASKDLRELFDKHQAVFDSQDD